MARETANRTATAATRSNTVGSKRPYHKARYEARKAAGLCGYCGKTSAVEGKTRCASCAKKERDRGRAEYAKDPKRRKLRQNVRVYRDWYYTRKYGITLEEYEAMLKSQRGRCAICRCKPKRALDVDHCHKRGHIRGLLCASCNTAIGHLEESSIILNNAIAYLQRTKRKGLYAR